MDAINTITHWLGDYALNTVELLGLGFILFTPLAVWFPCKVTQRVLRPDLGIDLLFFILRAIYSPIQTFLQSMFVAGRLSVLSLGAGFAPLPQLSTLPMVVQVLIMLLVIDFMHYVIHRWTHKKFFWRFHAIHHSSTSVDWLSGSRWHPINTFLHIIPQALMASLGFSSDAIFMVVVIGAANNQLAHANLNWTFGPLRYVFASPVYHHWHHTNPSEGGERNFAQMFVFYDMLFGTCYMPKGLPSTFGAPHDAVPENFIGQLFYPFRRKAALPAVE